MVTEERRRDEKLRNRCSLCQEGHKINDQEINEFYCLQDLETSTLFVRFEVFTVVTMKNCLHGYGTVWILLEPTFRKNY
jgi:hypothetical protein